MDWKIFGHEWAVNLLQKHAAGVNLRHAYLFVGPEGIGRQTLALRFAKALNCSAPPEPGAFCDQCRDCRQIDSLTYPDLTLVAPEEDHKDVLIDQIRALQHTVALAPYASTYRIALLPDFQRSTEEAQNALLKTLEEPPDKVILLLTATALEGLLPTIVSRCEVLRLRPASIEGAQQYLIENHGLTTEKAALIAHLSGGRIGAAITYSQEPDRLLNRQEQMQAFLGLLPARRYERFGLAKELSKSYDAARQNAAEVLSVWLSFWRDVFVHCSGASMPLVNIDYADQVAQAAEALTPTDARDLVVAHETALNQLDANVNVRLLLETVMLRWPALSISGDFDSN